MFNLFFCVLVVSVGLFFFRYWLTQSYVNEKRLLPLSQINEKDYTIMQPILSGDPRLKHDLEQNLANTNEMHFIWLIDKSDVVAQQIAETILQNPAYSKRTTCLFLEDTPEKINPKSFKLKQGISEVDTLYTIILDDDSVIDFEKFHEMSLYEQRADEFLVTGIPYNYGQTNFWSQLVAGFVNSHALFIYFSMAKVQGTKTINGMFYIAKTDLLKKYNVFEAIQDQLCDDLALAEFLDAQNVQLIQSCISCNVRTTVKHFQPYIRLMKRWLLFTTIYMRRHFSVKLFCLVILPSILPVLLLILGFWSGRLTSAGAVLLMVIKAMIVKYYREKTFSLQEAPMSLFYEIVSDFLLPLLCMYTLCTPSVIIWRNKKIRVFDGKIRYE